MGKRETKSREDRRRLCPAEGVKQRVTEKDLLAEGGDQDVDEEGKGDPDRTVKDGGAPFSRRQNAERGQKLVYRDVDLESGGDDRKGDQRIKQDLLFSPHPGERLPHISPDPEEERGKETGGDLKALERGDAQIGILDRPAKGRGEGEKKEMKEKDTGGKRRRLPGRAFLSGAGDRCLCSHKLTPAGK